MATLAAKKSSRLREFFLLLTSPFKLINQLRLRRKAKKEARKSDVEVHPLERICPAWLHVLQPPAKDDGAAKAAELTRLSALHESLAPVVKLAND